MLKITNRLLKQSAESRGWKVEVLSENPGILRYSLPENLQVILQSTISPFTPAISVAIADDKYTTFLLAKENAVPVAMTHKVQDEEEGLRLLEQYGEIILKPAGEAHGNGVSTQLTTPEQVKLAYRRASSFKSTVIVQPQLQGKDVRVVIIGGKLAAAATRHPASVTGDGKQSLRELILAENNSENRSPGYFKALNLINIKAAEVHLGKKIDEISVKGEEYVVVGAANIGTGGTCEDITDSISSVIIADSKMILSAAGLETGAADFIVNKESHTLLEINANPSFGLHTYPSIGKSHDVAGQYLDWLYAKLKQSEGSVIQL
ncbi:MAG: hypothetical protein M3Q14_04570 [bacterium]|nr:hypothetical protein [bacterium]